MNPKQRIWLEIRAICISLGYSVHDTNPPDDEPYPFVKLGEQLNQGFRDSKTSRDEQTQVTVHFWHNNERQRGTLSHMMHETEQAVLQTASIHDLTIEIGPVDSQIIDDTTTNTKLLHGILEFNIKYY